jgi:hypothetical protein
MLKYNMGNNAINIMYSISLQYFDGKLHSTDHQPLQYYPIGIYMPGLYEGTC